jgi:hypothetical protein
LRKIRSAWSKRSAAIRIWSRSTARADPVENKGHPFGEDLPDRDKKALIAFLATL